MHLKRLGGLSKTAARRTSTATLYSLTKTNPELHLRAAICPMTFTVLSTQMMSITNLRTTLKIYSQGCAGSASGFSNLRSSLSQLHHHKQKLQQEQILPSLFPTNINKSIYKQQHYWQLPKLHQKYLKMHHHSLGPAFLLYMISRDSLLGSWWISKHLATSATTTRFNSSSPCNKIWLI